MTRAMLLAALACFGFAIVLARRALARLGIARQLLGTASQAVGARAGGFVKVEGVLEPEGVLLIAPFSERSVLYVRAVLYGPRPGGTSWDVLWDKVLSARARVVDEPASLRIDLADARVLVTREYRQGSLRALLPDVRVLPRVLSRAGYREPPPPNQHFLLFEEVLVPGQSVTVVGEHDGTGSIGRGPRGAPLIAGLNPTRVVLRVAWGPALALLLAAICAITGATVVGTWWWLR